MIQRGSSTTVTSKMELNFTIFESIHALTVVAKVFILDAEDVFNGPLITDIFASQSWILIHLKTLSPLYGYQSINSNGKENGWLLCCYILISNCLGKPLYT